MVVTWFNNDTSHIGEVTYGIIVNQDGWYGLEQDEEIMRVTLVPGSYIILCEIRWDYQDILKSITAFAGIERSSGWWVNCIGQQDQNRTYAWVADYRTHPEPTFTVSLWYHYGVSSFPLTPKIKIGGSYMRAMRIR